MSNEWMIYGSGRFDRDGNLLKRAWHRLRLANPRVSLTAGSEASHRNNQWLDAKGWTLVHGRKNSETMVSVLNKECWLAFRNSVWEQVGKVRFPTVSHKTYYSSFGNLRRSHRVLRVKLKHKATGQTFIFYVVHMSLDNTLTRSLVWKDEAKGLANLIRRDKRVYPHAKQVLLGDINKNARESKDRAKCITRLAIPANLRPAWNANTIPATGGTHGPRGIIDHAYATRGLITACSLIKPTPLLRKASDHTPFKFRMTF